MRVFLTTVAGSATRFSESVGKPTVKCIYNRVRIAVKDTAENDKFLEALKESLMV